MKKDRNMGWFFIILCLIMVFCIIFNIFNDNWEALPICIFALILNISNALNRFNDYKRYKELEKSIQKFQENSLDSDNWIK